MDPEKYNRVKDIFLGACEKPAEERAAYVQHAAAGDAELQNEVESLLKEYSREKQLMPSEPEAPLGDLSTLLSRANIDLPSGPEAADADDPVTEKIRGSCRPRSPLAPEDSYSSSSGSGFIDAGRFMAGTMVAGRYRIIELLGRGGMGEVYRADDITLNQSVALKFLPALFGSDQKWLDRFRNEVRLSRQVTHPNVCRVFDIGEFQGEQFISMEYVDGEDLASLLRRIGRVPHDKALQIARQLCAGLAAAHDKGVLHRDLKPANVMIDGRGSVRITDFGLAAPVDQMRREAAGGGRAGTPAYMSPEQLAGRGVTVRSDVYSLGLLLYEMFTGRRAFKGNSLRDYQKLHTSEDPTPPSEIIDDIDPIVERVIMKCLEKDPKNRPASAMAVSAALPGGDPLREILAAGDIPSPEVVAAAGETQGGLAVRRATGFLLVGLLSLILVVLVARDAFLIPQALDKSPAVLSDKAATLLHEKLGYPDVHDRASGFSLNLAYYQHVDEDTGVDRWKKFVQLRPGVIHFWYRESPDYLVPLQPDSAVQENDPPALRAGVVRVVLNAVGNLVSLEARPQLQDRGAGTRPTTAPLPESTTEPAIVENPPWARPLLEAAAVDSGELTPVRPTGVPPVYADERAAWDLNVAGEEMHIEAGAVRGRPVYFALHGDWQHTPVAGSREQRLFDPDLNLYLQTVLSAGLLVAGAYLAWRNYRSGRGDRPGALRMGIAFLGFGVIAWVLRAHHVPNLLHEFRLFQTAMGAIIYRVVVIWVFYLALEPYVRRVWPETVISWNRLLGGKWFDPLVARDILIGSAVGVFTMVLSAVDMLAPRWLGFPAPLPRIGSINFVLNSLTSYSVLFSGAIFALYFALILLLIVVLLRMALKRKPLVFIAFVLLFVAISARWRDYPDYITFITQALIAMFIFTLLIRHGLVALVFCLLVRNFLSEFPITSEVSLWYANIAFVGIAAVVVLLGVSFYTTLGGRSPLVLRPRET